MTENALWFEQPARTWNEALPLGNGILGAMVFGGPLSELIQLNDGRAWSGSPANEFAEPRIEPAVAAAALAEARDAIVARDFVGADTALQRIQHRYSQTYLPFADLRLVVSPSGRTAGEVDVGAYRRSLNLQSATHESSYLLDGYLTRWSSYVSSASGVLVIEIDSEDPDGIDLDLVLTSQLEARSAPPRLAPGGSDVGLLLRMPCDVSPSHDEFDEPVRYSSDDSHSMQGAVVVRILADTAHATAPAPAEPAATLTLRKTRAVTLIVATETTFVGLGKHPAGTAEEARARAAARIDAAVTEGLQAVRERHLVDHAALYDRVRLTTGKVSDRPTDTRLVVRSAPDPDPARAPTSPRRCATTRASPRSCSTSGATC